MRSSQFLTQALGYAGGWYSTSLRCPIDLTEWFLACIFLGRRMKAAIVSLMNGLELAV